MRNTCSTLALTFDLVPVPAMGLFIHAVLESGPAAGHVLRFRRRLSDHFHLALIAAISPHLLLFAVAVSHPAYARQTRWLLKCTPSAHGPPWHPHRYAAWPRNTTAGLYASDASGDRAGRWSSWSMRVRE